MVQFLRRYLLVLLCLPLPLYAAQCVTTVRAEDSITKTVFVKANGNYTGSDPDNENYVAESASGGDYGKWVDTGMALNAAWGLRLKTKGLISLKVNRLTAGTQTSQTFNMNYNAVNGNLGNVYCTSGTIMTYGNSLVFSIGSQGATACMHNYNELCDGSVVCTCVNWGPAGMTRTGTWLGQCSSLRKIYYRIFSATSLWTSGSQSTNGPKDSSLNLFTQLNPGCFDSVSMNILDTYRVTGLTNVYKYQPCAWLQDGDGRYGDNMGGFELTFTYTPAIATTNTVFWAQDGIAMTDVVAGDGLTSLPDLGTIEMVLQNADPNTTSTPAASNIIQVNNGTYPAATNGQQPYHTYPATQGPAKIWLRMKTHSSLNYADMSGFYEVTLEVKPARPPSAQSASTVINGIVNPVKASLRDATALIYNQVVNNGNYFILIKMTLTLYIILYGLMFLMGMVDATQLELVKRVVKIGIIITLIGEDSWAFFNNHLFTLFTNGVDELLKIATGSTAETLNASVDGVITTSTNDNTFAFVDQTLGIYFEKNTWIKASGLIVTSYVGIIYFAMLIYGILVYMWVLFQAVLGYLFALVGVAFLVSIAPIMIPFMLFKVTKSVFDEWIKALVYFAFFPVLLFATIMLINEFMMLALNEALNLTACWECAIPISIGGINTCLEFWKVVNIPLWQLFTNFIIFLIMSKLMLDSLDLVPNLIERMLGYTSARGLKLTGAGSASSAVVDAVKSAVAASMGVNQDMLDKLENKDKGGGGGGGGGG
jgi:type IV secretory pathway VirB6-like protein